MRIASIILLAALPAAAQFPSEFRSGAPIATRGTDALQQLELPYEVYRDARRDLADVRVFNAARESVPIAWAGPPRVELESAPPVDLPLFPVSKLEAEPGKGGTEVTIRTADGTLVAVKGGPRRSSGRTDAKPAAYLLDASATKEPLQALVFDWRAGPGTEVVTVRVESSDDLKAWSRLAATPLVRIESEGRALVQPRVEFAPRKVKYFRVTWDAPGFSLAGVKAEHEPRGKAVPRKLRRATATVGKDGEFLYDLGARLPVEAIRLDPAQENAVVAAAIHAREEADAPWRLVANAAFYRLQRDGTEVRSPMLEIGRRPARYWMVKLAAGSSTGDPPALEAEWTGARLVFVAQGAAPYSLAFGNPNAASTALQLSAVIPRYEKGMELALPEAQAGAVTAGPPPTRWEGIIGSLNPRRVTLWAILAGGVALLGFMAWRISRQMRR
jgi:hypothetical protein